MYRARQRRTRSLLFFIALGFAVGIGFFVYGQLSWSSSPASSVVSLSTPTFQPAAISVAETPLPIPTNEPSVLLVIPKMNVGAQVVHVFLDHSGRWDVSQLGNSAGALQGTAWIDHPGNIVLVGHVELSDGRLGIFAGLKNLQIGDEVMLVRSEDDPMIYSVNSVRSVEPDDLSVLYPSSQNMLTLITCDSYDFLSNTYLTRTVVTATSIHS